MELVIKSRKLGKVVTFSRPGREYIFVDMNGQSGTLGYQICEGGKFFGSCMTSYGGDYEHFERTCRRWYRAYIKGLT